MMSTKRAAILLAAIGVTAALPAASATFPFGGAPVGVPSATALAIQCPNGTTTCFGGSGGAVPTTIVPMALKPTTVGAAGMYQLVAAAGKAATNGGFVQPSAGNGGLICIDISGSAAAGLTTPTGGQLCQVSLGSTAPITFPPTAGPVYVYGAVKGDTFSGSVS